MSRRARALAWFAWPAVALAENSPAENSAGESVVACSESSEKAHMLGVQMDWGRQSAYGLVYGHDWVQGQHCGGLGAIVHGRLGAAVTLATRDHSDVDAYGVGPVASFGLAGDGGLFEYEVQPTVFFADDDVGGALSLGAFFGYRFFALGYVYAFALHPRGRPDWLASHRFALRIAVPLHTYATRERTFTQPRSE